jgi:hypothetical protein
MAQLGRRAYRYNKETGEMEECVPTPRIKTGRIDDNFVSPIDGSIITTQRKLHDHNQRNGVVQVTPEIQHGWDQAKAKREDFFTGHKAGKNERVGAIRDSIAKLESGYKPKIRRMDDAP